MMMMSNIEREEMLDYLRILSGLNNTGFRCEHEIRDVLEIVHGKEFGFADGKIKKQYRYDELRKIIRHEVARTSLKDGIANQGKLIRVTEKDRQVGKTSILIDYAHTFGLTIVVGNESLIEYTRQLARKELGVEGDNIPILVGKLQNLLGRKLPNGILIDCSVKLEDYQEIAKHIHIRGGFHHDRLFI